jgi:ubiquinone/menaquinone biosynthesis C-methylase UbiE/uncharacterized protein YbaR (Trm112 family)
MLKTLIDRLLCPECTVSSTTLSALDFAPDDSEHIENGVLRCEGCARLFLIEDGVLEILGDGLRDEPARYRFEKRFEDILAKQGLLEDIRRQRQGQTAGLDDQIRQREHFDWYAENGTQSYSAYQRTPFWTACDERVLARWRPLMRADGWVLDLGCADGRGGLRFLEKSNRVLAGFDISRKMVERAVARAKAEQVYGRCSFLVADANNPPFRERSFEYAVTYGVLHHLPDPGRSCREIQRILKVGGRHFALENNKTLFRPIFDLLMKLRPIWTEEAGKEPLISEAMVQDWVRGLPAKLTTSTTVFLPPHLLNLVGLPMARRLLGLSDSIFLGIPGLGGLGGEIVIEIEKTA